jgi:hypothetical protein
MDILSTGSTWLITMASALSPLIALLIGFTGTDWWLRRQLAEKRERCPVEGRRSERVLGARGAGTGAGAER